MSYVEPLLGSNFKLVKGLPQIAPCLEHICAGGGGNVAIEVIYMYWCLTRTGLNLSVECCITCVDLLFSNSRVQSYNKRGSLLDLRTEVQTVPPDEHVGHVGNVPVRRRWVQLARRPVIMI